MVSPPRRSERSSTYVSGTSANAQMSTACSVRDCAPEPPVRKPKTEEVTERGGWPMCQSMAWRRIFPTACVMHTRLSECHSQP